MSNSASHRSVALILAIDESIAGVGEALIRLSGVDSADAQGRAVDAMQVDVAGAGDALRVIYRRSPLAVFVCVGPACVDASSALIDALHARRPKLPVIAVAAEHDELLERAVRAAGANVYFDLSSKTDEGLIRRTIAQLASRRETHSGLSPPGPGHPARPRARPAVRLRPRYGRSSFD